MPVSPIRAQIIMPVLAITAEKDNAETDAAESKKFPQEFSGVNETGMLQPVLLERRAD